ncbi:hypothetical protein PoB_007129300 [Plakobranchus ocellatus]|uniref:Secreted protein n=1 Tax=Plakobranchus ocellatus TaxID=259542 RepID=A0AAV4DKK7_9GAST|nr:hypothetical protein PoB_007129300 [Plakobranchus ocellatus]
MGSVALSHGLLEVAVLSEVRHRRKIHLAWSGAFRMARRRNTRNMFAAVLISTLSFRFDIFDSAASQPILRHTIAESIVSFLIETTHSSGRPTVTRLV